jgi:hypothetical protein
MFELYATRNENRRNRKNPRRAKTLAAYVEPLESRQLLSVTASNSFGINPTTNAIDVPAIDPDPANPNDPADDEIVHNLSLTINNDAGVPSTVVNGVTTATINSSAINSGNPSQATINLSGIIVGPFGFATFPYNPIIRVEVNGVDTSDITSTTDDGYNPVTKRDSISFAGTVNVPAVAGTDNIGLVLEIQQLMLSTPNIPFFAVTVNTNQPTVSSVGPIANSASAISSAPVKFSEPIVSSSFKASDVALTRNGSPVQLSGLTITPTSGSGLSSGFTISGLSPYTSASGTYVLSVSPAGTMDAANNAGTGSPAAAGFTITLPPVVVVDSAIFTTIKMTTVKGEKSKTTTDQALQVTYSGPLTGVLNLGAYQLLGGKTKKVKGKSTASYVTPIHFKSAMPVSGGLVVDLIPSGKLKFSQRDQLMITASDFVDSLGRPLEGNQTGPTGGNSVEII